jgi:hypothetical protein
MVPSDVRDMQIELAAVIQSAIQTMPMSTVMLFEFTIPDYHHIVIQKIAEAQKIHLVAIDDNAAIPYYQELRNSPLFIDITKYNRNAAYQTWLYNTCRRWRANSQPVIIFAPYVSTESHQYFATWTDADSFAIDRCV